MFILTLFVLLSLAESVAVVLPDEQRLVNELINKNKYDNSVRPVMNASNNVVVMFGYTLIQIMDMEEVNQVFVTNAWLEHKVIRQADIIKLDSANIKRFTVNIKEIGDIFEAVERWKDERMGWNASEYNNLKVLRIPASKLWLPDIVLYNNADDYTTGFMSINAMVHHDGWVFWSPPARLRNSCKVDITYFPFDKQRCKQKFGSWSYPKGQVDLVALSETVDLSAYTTNGEWILSEYRIVRHEIKYPIGDDLYPDVTVEFIIRRRILYYVLNIIFPCFWLNVLSVLTFCLPPDAGEKITLSITVLLSYSVFMLLVAESMPPTSEFVPLIGIYLTMSMAVASVSVILTVLVMKLHHCAPQQKRVPKWVRIIVLGILAKIVRCSCSSGVRSIQSEFRIRKQKSSFKYKHDDQQADTNAKLFGDIVTRHEIDDSEETLSENEIQVNSPKTGSSQYNFSGSLTSLNVSQPASVNDISNAAIQKTASDILRCLKYLVVKSDDNDSEEDIISEWKQVALVVDRLMFWTFLLITIFSTLVILVIVPISAYGDFPGL